MKMTNEEAKAIISNEYKCVDRDCDIERSCGKCDLMMPNKEPILKAYKLAIKALEQTTWIPVSERLPEEYGEYLITWKNPKYSKTYIGICECEITDVYDHEHNRFEVEWLFDGHITTAYPDSYVIAWMPLPEPYKGE